MKVRPRMLVTNATNDYGTTPAYFLSITGTTVSGSATVSSLSATTSISAGQLISGAGIPAGTTVVSVNSGASTLVLSNKATASAAGVSIKIQSIVTLVSSLGSDVNTYEIFDSSGNLMQIYYGAVGGPYVAGPYIMPGGNTAQIGQLLNKGMGVFVVPANTTASASGTYIAINLYC